MNNRIKMVDEFRKWSKERIESCKNTCLKQCPITSCSSCQYDASGQAAWIYQQEIINSTQAALDQKINTEFDLSRRVRELEAAIVEEWLAKLGKTKTSDEV